MIKNKKGYAEMNLVIIVIMLLIGAVFSVIIARNINKYPTDEEKNNVTSFLNEKQITLYYSDVCPYCEEQKNFINFTLLENKILVNGFSYKEIQGVPAWEYKEELYYGMLTHKEIYKKYG